ncbi:MAG: Assymetric_cell_division_FstX, partial [uncultured Solirubrobacteraceae bacterium]
ELRLRPARGAARPAPQRRSQLRRDGDRPGHRPRPGRLHPGGPGHHRRRRRGPLARDRRRVPEGQPDARRHRARRAPAHRGGAERRPGRVHLQGGGLPRRARAPSRVLRPARQEPAARHVPRHAGPARGHRRAARLPHAGGARRRAHEHRSGDRRGPRPRGGHPEDPLGDARHQAHDGRARRPARPGLGAAGGQHHPPVALRAAPRGRGDEAGRRHRLVHPLAVRHRGSPGGRLRRAHRHRADGRLEGGVPRSAARGLPVAERRADDELRPADGRAAARRRRRLGARLRAVAAPLPARL